MRGIEPEEAMTRLNKFKREYESLSRKHDLYQGGERLFGLPESQYPELMKVGKELRLLDSLYSLYQAVITTVDQVSIRNGPPFSSGCSTKKSRGRTLSRTSTT